jgi:hypothetical protein
MLVIAENHRLSVHVLSGETKAASHTPEDAVSSLCPYVHGDHAYFIDDPLAKSTIAQTMAVRPQSRPEFGLKIIAKNEVPPLSEWAEWHGEGFPGHVAADDLAQVRRELHSSSI